MTRAVFNWPRSEFGSGVRFFVLALIIIIIIYPSVPRSKTAKLSILVLTHTLSVPLRSFFDYYDASSKFTRETQATLPTWPVPACKWTSKQTSRGIPGANRTIHSTHTDEKGHLIVTLLSALMRLSAHTACSSGTCSFIKSTSSCWRSS